MEKNTIGMAEGDVWAARSYEEAQISVELYCRLIYCDLATNCRSRTICRGRRECRSLSHRVHIIDGFSSKSVQVGQGKPDQLGDIRVMSKVGKKGDSTYRHSVMCRFQCPVRWQQYVVGICIHECDDDDANDAKHSKQYRKSKADISKHS